MLDELEISDLNLDTIHAYRSRHVALRPNHVWEKLSDAEYLEQIGAARQSRTDKRIRPTGAGLLMFGEEYKILYEYQEYFLDYREMLDPTIRWTDRLQSSSGDWTGNLFGFFFRVNSKITKDLKIPFKLDGITRIDDIPVHKAMREALANCLTNTDFFVPRGIVIRKDAEHVIMENPGYIRTGKNQMLKGGISDPRNKALMKMFNIIGIGERAGSGVPDIFDVWKSQGWETPVIEEQYNPDRTILILPFVQKQLSQGNNGSKIQNEPINEPINSTGYEKTLLEKRIIDILVMNSNISQPQMAEIIGVSLSSVKRTIKKMVESGQIKHEGSKKSGRWIVL